MGNSTIGGWESIFYPKVENLRGTYSQVWREPIDPCFPEELDDLLGTNNLSYYNGLFGDLTQLVDASKRCQIFVEKCAKVIAITLETSYIDDDDDDLPLDEFFPVSKYCQPNQVDSEWTLLGFDIATRAFHPYLHKLLDIPEYSKPDAPPQVTNVYSLLVNDYGLFNNLEDAIVFQHDEEVDDWVHRNRGPLVYGIYEICTIELGSIKDDPQGQSGTRE